jgi:hypothetical protein
MTIVNPESLVLLGSVAESDAFKIRVGTAGKLTPTAMKSERLDVVVRSVSSVPFGDGQFEVSLDLQNSGGRKDLVAGMSGSVRVLSYFNARALTVPASAVLADEFDDTVRYVNLWLDGKPVRRNVEIGVTHGELVEVRSGLSANDEVLKEKPKPE